MIENEMKVLMAERDALRARIEVLKNAVEWALEFMTTLDRDQKEDIAKCGQSMTDVVPLEFVEILRRRAKEG
jgi:hypothetical protein